MTKAFVLKLSSICILLGYLSSNGHSKEENRIKTDCQSVRIYYDLPLVTDGGKIMDVMNDSFDIYYLKQYTIYKFHWIVTTRIDPDSTLDTMRPNFFVFKNESERGYWFDENKNIIPYPVDSILKIFAFYKADFYKLFPDSLVEVERIHTNNQLEIKFITRKKPNIENPDTVKYYLSDKMKNIEFSLSKSLDNVERLKGYRYSGIFNSRYYKGYDFKFPRREVFVEMKSIKNDENCKEASRYIDFVKDKY